MLNHHYIRANLAGAWAVMRGRPAGLALLDTSVDGFWRSFGAILLILPFAVLTLFSQRKLLQALGDSAAPVGAGFSLNAAALLADWVAFPLVFALLARPLGLAARYVPFIVARNWAAVLVAAIVALVHAGHVVGLLPSDILPFALLLMIGLALYFSYLIARTALDVTIVVAFPIVLLDLLISLTIWSIVDGVT